MKSPRMFLYDDVYMAGPIRKNFGFDVNTRTYISSQGTR